MDRLISCSREYQRSSTINHLTPVRGLIILIGVEDPRSGLIIPLSSFLPEKVSSFNVDFRVQSNFNFFFLVPHFSLRLCESKNRFLIFDTSSIDSI